MLRFIDKPGLLAIIWQEVVTSLKHGESASICYERVRPLPRVQVTCNKNEFAFDFPEDGGEPIALQPSQTPSVFLKTPMLVYIPHTFMGGAVGCKLSVNVHRKAETIFSITVDRDFPAFDSERDGLYMLCRLEDGSFKEYVPPNDARASRF